MSLIEDIKKIIAEYPAEIKEDGDKVKFEFVIAERKTWLSSKKLVYKGEFKINEGNKEVTFSEMLKESGFGISASSFSGGSDDMSPGFGFKAGTYKTGMGGNEGTIQEQSDLFGKKYEYKFDFGKIRKAIEEVSKNAGYTFAYKIFGA